MDMNAEHEEECGRLGLEQESTTLEPWFAPRADHGSSPEKIAAWNALRQVCVKSKQGITRIGRNVRC